MPTRVLSEVTNRSAVRPPSGTVRQSGVGCSNARRTGSGKGVVLRHSRLFPKLVECSSSTRVSAQASQATSNTAATNNASESNQSKTSGPKICIVGGGFGGLYTALRLSTLVWTGDLKPEITLIDQRDRFVFKPLLYEVCEIYVRVRKRERERERDRSIGDFSSFTCGAFSLPSSSLFFLAPVFW